MAVADMVRCRWKCGSIYAFGAAQPRCYLIHALQRSGKRRPGFVMASSSPSSVVTLSQAPPTGYEGSNMGSEAVDQIKNFLKKILRITITDGRIFIGTFAGTDKPLNIILVNADEFRIDTNGVCSEGRFVGQVMFPWKMVVKVEVQTPNRKQEDRGGIYIWYG